MGLVDSLYSKKFDFLPTDVDTELMIATLPRAGSTFFCIELWKTGVLGAPLEYANSKVAGQLKSRLPPGHSLTEFWSSVKKLRTSPNGVFSYKMFMSMYLDNGRKDSAMLKMFTPDSVIYLTREDKLAQAISYSKAIRSRVWFADAVPQTNADYDEQHIELCMSLIKQQETFWENVFSMTNTKVFNITYEQFLASPEQIKIDICKWLGVSFDGEDKVDIPSIKIQRDSTNKEWQKRHLEKSKSGAVL